VNDRKTIRIDSRTLREVYFVKDRQVRKKTESINANVWPVLELVNSLVFIVIVIQMYNFDRTYMKIITYASQARTSSHLMI